MTRSTIEIQSDIARLQHERDGLLPLKDVAKLEQRLAVVGAQAQLDPALRGELVFADQAVKDAKAAWLRNGEINSQLRILESELSVAEATARQIEIDAANRALADAENAYVEAAKASIRAYRRLQHQYHLAGLVRPHRTQLLAAPGIPWMVQVGSIGDPSQIIGSALCYWEQKEVEQERAAA